MAICLDYQGPTLDEILLRHGLKATDLERLCPLEVRNEVAILIKDWEMVGHCLNFAPEKIRDIDRENRSQDQCKVALLDTWSKREGKGATYLKLADVFHRRKRRDLVELLCEKVKSSMRLVPLSGTPDASLDISTTVKPHHISIAKGYPDTVSLQIESLEEQFDDIHSRLVTELTEVGTLVEEVLQALTKLPFAFRKQYQDTIQSMLPNLETKDRISSLFHLLNPLFTFIDYELLKHLVSKFGSSKLKGDMSVYIEKVQLFKKATTVSELIEYWPGLELPESNYSRFTAKIGGDPGAYTLEELDNFRRKFFCHLKLSDFVSVSILMLLEHTNSFIAIWLIPTTIVPELKEAFNQMDNVFCQDEHILELSVDERISHQENVRLEELTSVDEPVLIIEPVSASTRVMQVNVPSQHTEDTLYSILVFSKEPLELFGGHDVYIAAYSDNITLKILKQQRTECSVSMVMKRLNFKYNKKDCDPCLKVLPKGDIELESGDGMIRPSDIWRESQHEDMHWLDRYHLKMILHYPFLGSIEFEGSTDDSQMKVKFKLDFIAARLIMEDQSRRRQEPAEQNFVPYEDVHFGYHSATGEGIRIFSNGLGAERMNPTTLAFHGVVYGAHPFKGVAKFEVEIVSYGAGWRSSLRLGVTRCEKGVPICIESIPINSSGAMNHCVWSGQELYNNLVTPREVSDYGSVNLKDLGEGDHVGLLLSQDGVLEFTVNGESQGIAARNIYTRNSDVYAVVDHQGNCVATVITKSVTQHEDINLQELCLAKLSNWLKSCDQVDSLPLPTRLKDKLKEYFIV